MNTNDLCLAWNWEHDADFVMLLNHACCARGLSLLQATPRNIEELLPALINQQLAFHVFLDRASEHEVSFKPLVQWVSEHGVKWINSHEKTARSCNKAVMHHTLIHAGLYTPYTIILPSYKEQPFLAPVDLQPLGNRFTIKPAHGGGGEGVIMDATSMVEVLIARQEHEADQYLLQAQIITRELESRPAWFRVIYCTGQVYPCWWDPQSHIYAPVTSEDQNRFYLSPLYEMVATIARISELELLSTEIALTPEGLFVVVDYVNDQIDLRLQSKANDGVPDYIVHTIAERLADLVASRKCLSQ